MEMDTHKNTKIIYELPLSEAVRICLRIEKLFEQFDYSAHAKTISDAKQAMVSLLKILDFVDRPDIKSKISQTLTQYNQALSQLKTAPQVDQQRLTLTLDHLSTLNHQLHTKNERLDEALRKNEFLSQIRSHMANPGGIADYRLPNYMLWQQQSIQIKSQQLNNWIDTLTPLRKMVETIMQLTRDSAGFESVIADNGFYHKSFNPQHPYQLARIRLPLIDNAYPEFGAGKHRLTIRFLSPNYLNTGRPSQIQKPLTFELCCCKL